MHRIVLSCVSPELDTRASGDLFWLLWSGVNDYFSIHTQSDRSNPYIWKLSKSRQSKVVGEKMLLALLLHFFTLEQLINNHWHLEILPFVPSATCEGNVSKSRQSILSVTFATYIQLLILVLWSLAFISSILICIRVFLLGINGQRGGRDQGGGSILPHSKYNDNATTLRLPCFKRKPLLILLLLLLAAPLVSHFKALKGSHPHQCWCRRERDKFFVNIGRRKMDRWNMTTVYSFNVLRSKGGAPRTIKWSKQQNKSFDVFDWPSFNIFDWPSTEF